MHVAREIIKEYIEMFASGIDLYGIAQKHGLQEKHVNQQLNKYGFTLTTMRSWRKQGKTAQEMYEMVYPLQAEPVEEKAVEDPVSTNQILILILDELRSISTVLRDKPTKQSDRILLHPTNKTKKPERAYRPDNLKQPEWSLDDLSVMMDSIDDRLKGTSVTSVCRELTKIFPDRTAHSIASRYYKEKRIQSEGTNENRA